MILEVWLDSFTQPVQDNQVSRTTTVQLAPTTKTSLTDFIQFEMDAPLPGYNFSGTDRVSAILFDNATNQTFSDTESCVHTVRSIMGPNYQKTKFSLDICIVPIVCCLGFFGNVLSFIVLNGKSMKHSTTSLLLRALAITDNIYLLACLFFQTLVSLYHYNFRVHQTLAHFPYVQPFIWYAGNASQTSVVWITVLVTVDRYVAICWTHSRGKFIGTKLGAWIGIGVTVTSALIFNIPVYHDLSVILRNASCSSSALPTAVPSLLFFNKTYQLVYKTIFCFFFRSFIPFVLLAFCNIKLFRTIKAASDVEVSRIHHSRRKNNKYFTTVLVSVVAVFLSCAVPDLVFRIVRTIMYHWPESGISIVFISYFGTFSNFLLTLNSSVNICIYCMTGTNFRDALKSLFRSNKGQVSQSPRLPLKTYSTSVTR